MKDLHDNVFGSNRLFLCLGIGLIILSITLLPIKMQVNFQDTINPDYEEMNVGFFFGLFVGCFGVASLVFGLAEGLMSKKIVNNNVSRKVLFSILFAVPLLYVLVLWLFYLTH